MHMIEIPLGRVRPKSNFRVMHKVTKSVHTFYKDVYGFCYGWNVSDIYDFFINSDICVTRKVIFWTSVTTGSHLRQEITT